MDGEPWPAPVRVPRSRRGKRKVLLGAAEALIQAVQPLARHGEPVRLGLSGGRDSRLMAAVLHAAGVPFTARTHGFADSPDVVLAARIAKALGVEHEVALTGSRERPEWIEVEHPLDRAVHVIRMCEGMTSAYEQVNRYAPYSLRPGTSGSGGETLRGGFLYDQDDITLAGLRRRVRTIFLSAEDFVTPEGNARARRMHQDWDPATPREGLDALDQLYLRYRTGRWIVGSHTATWMNSPDYHPFFDDRVVREFLALPAEWRRSEEPVSELIGLLAPELRDIPIEGKPWRFDPRKPSLTPTGGTSGFNMAKSFWAYCATR
jgi:hypothetical protein